MAETRKAGSLLSDPAVPTEADIVEFVAGAERPGWPTWALRRLLRPALNDFALNGLFGTYPLYLLSERHWAALLGSYAGGRLLDVGAAGGDVTRQLAPLFDEVVVTDTSRMMVRRLRRSGLRAVHTDLARAGLDEEPFDTVTLLNVLDRCDRPMQLLERAVGAGREGATIVISIPLPYDPWHYAGALPMRPRRPLPLPGSSFGDDLACLVDEVLPAAGLCVHRSIRTPYVSAGDRRRTEYRLDAAVLVAHRC